MEIKKINVAKENLNRTPYKIDRNFIAKGIIAASLVIGIGSNIINNVPNQSIQSDTNFQTYSEEQEQATVLKIRAENTEAIQTEKVKMVITNQDNLLMDYINIYPDGYMDIEQTSLYSGEDYTVIIDYNGEINSFNFSIPDNLVEYELVLDCETKEIKVVPTSQNALNSVSKSL